MARAAGFYVIGTASSEKKRELVKQEGAHPVFDHSAPGYVQNMLNLTQGRGVALILDMKIVFSMF